jgi:MFS transporter, CP family, cyanate transporter
MSDPSRLIVAAGVVAALHVAKLPPAVPALQEALGITLVQAGFLLSMVQLAGMSVGVACGAWADGLGAQRSMCWGLALLALASALGGAAPGVVMLMTLRALEGLGFLLVVLAGPGWLRAVAPPHRLNAAMGWWSAYMPTATALALLAGPLFTAELGWRWWWWCIAAITALMWAALSQVPAAPRLTAPGPAVREASFVERLQQTLSAPGPWLLAGVFALYAFQWLAVIGFLPTVYRQAGFSPAATGALTALVAAVNILGNLSAGRWLQRGVPPTRLLVAGLLTMAVAATGLYAGAGDQGLPPWLRYGCALAFSMGGGLVPATLFTLSVQVAPRPQLMATTVGWMQQGSALGQFCGPPAVAWVASLVGGWQWSFTVTASAALLALLLVVPLGRHGTMRH